MSSRVARMFDSKARLSSNMGFRVNLISPELYYDKH